MLVSLRWSLKPRTCKPNREALFSQVHGKTEKSGLTSDCEVKTEADMERQRPHGLKGLLKETELP